jgi:hypothetical protein
MLIAFLFFRKDWKKAYLIMIIAMIVDLEHLLANPIYQADRYSINFHLLHSYYAIAVYMIMIFLRRPFNLIGIGLLLHMLTDFSDCLMQN